MFNFFKKSQKEIEQQKALQDMANFAMQQKLQQQMMDHQAIQQHKMFMAGSAGAKVGSIGGGGGGGGLGGRTYVAPGHISAGYSPNDIVMIVVPCEDCGHRNEVPLDKKITHCYLCNAPIHRDDAVNSDGQPLFSAKHTKF